MSVNYAEVADKVREMLKRPEYDDGSLGPVLVRLAWHASGTYSLKDKSGGSDGGTMRFYTEAKDPANAGLDSARAFLEPLKAQYPAISYGDLWTLAGVVAVEAMGGPVVKWTPGRQDKLKESDCPPYGRLPDATQGAQHVRDIFNHRMGFNDREIVALSGAHSLGRCHKDRSGFDGPWTYTPTRFSNQYFTLLLNEKWTPVTKFAGGPEQFRNPDDDLMMLPTDIALITDTKFKKYVEMYAKDKQLFAKDFADAFARLLELGLRSPGKVTQVCPMSRSKV